jgi:ketosteroid isomerase-like protein
MRISAIRFFSSILFFTTTVCAQQETNEASLIMQLDRDFDRATTEKGIDGWMMYFAPNGSMLSDTNQPTTGIAAIRSEMEPVFKDSSFSLRWYPTKGEIMIPGVIGYTVGRWERLLKNKEGKLMKSTGTYSTTWKKQPDGSWKIILDSGNPDGSPVEVITVEKKGSRKPLVK